MPITCEHRERVRAEPSRAFDAIDDLPLTAQWLPPCVSLENTTHPGGPNAVGDALRYVFKQGGRTQEMAGRVTDRVAGRRLRCVYTDSVFEVTVDLRVDPDPDGTLMTHLIEIAPKTFMGRLFTPLIRLGLGKQTRTAAANLKRLLESEAAA
jgi:hypothetical protein